MKEKEVEGNVDSGVTEEWRDIRRVNELKKGKQDTYK